MFIRESNKQKSRMDESKTEESILVFYSHNITIVCYTEEKKVKTLLTCDLFIMQSAKGETTNNDSKMHIQVEALGYPSKQEVNDWNQRRRQKRPSNAIGVQFFM